MLNLVENPQKNTATKGKSVYKRKQSRLLFVI